jgi:hypothetical protein
MRIICAKYFWFSLSFIPIVGCRHVPTLPPETEVPRSSQKPSTEIPKPSIVDEFPLVPESKPKILEEKEEYTHQELVDYINSSYYFPKIKIGKGSFLYRCEDPDVYTPPNYPWFLAYPEFKAYEDLVNGLCEGKDLFRYIVIHDFEVIDFRANQKRGELPNKKIIENNKTFADFHHDTLTNNDRGHIIDYALQEYVTKTGHVHTHNRWSKKGIKRVQYFCEDVIENPIYKESNKTHSVIGWLDYDVGIYSPSHEELGTQKKEDHTDSVEFLLCFPDRYIQVHSIKIEGWWGRHYRNEQKTKSLSPWLGGKEVPIIEK